jgi:hypothetical protein
VSPELAARVSPGVGAGVSPELAAREGGGPGSGAVSGSARAVPGAEERAAIADLHHTGLWALDTGDLELYLATFWPEADFSEVGPDGVRRSWTGFDEIHAMSESRFDGPSRTQHRLSNHLYAPRTRPGDPDARGWTVWSYWLTSVRDPETGEVELRMSGHLRDEVEEREGEWRLAGRHLDGWPDDLAHPLAAPAAAPAGDVDAAVDGSAS